MANPSEPQKDSQLFRQLAQDPLLFAIGLASACPQNDRRYDCPLAAFEGLPLSQKMDILESMGHPQLAELLQHHAECLARRSMPRSAREPDPSGDGLVVLLAEGDRHTRLSLELTLKRASHRIVHADSAVALLQIVDSMSPDERRSIDLLVTDLNMPGMKGEALVRRLDAIGLVLPVVVITAYGSNEVEAELARRGNVSILRKPFHPGDLVRVVRDAKARFSQSAPPPGKTPIPSETHP